MQSAKHAQDTPSMGISQQRRSSKQASRKERWKPRRIVTVMIAVLGLAVLHYPTAAAWVSDLGHTQIVNGYVQQVEALNDEEVASRLDEARRFNDNLPAGPLRDPYALGPDGQEIAIGEGTDAYFNTLVDEPGDMMGRIRIPSIDVDLPIYHGTDETTLAEGVGHLFPSALPVGGEDTHSVLTAHSGFVGSTLFNDLEDVDLGDIFTVSVLGEELYYEVDDIRIVEPHETESLRQENGADRITLITCTPIGVNTHRLLVSGIRVDGPVAEDPGQRALPMETKQAGFPWWAITFLGGTVGAIVLTKPRGTQDTDAPTLADE